MQSYGIHWFRRDLRVRGNPALLWNHQRSAGRVLGIFFFDSSFLSRPDFSHVRFAFFIDSLKALQDELRLLGGDLLVLDRLPHEGFQETLGLLKKSIWGLPTTVSFNRDYEPFARKRDHKVREMIKSEFGIDVHTERDHLLIEPGELPRPAGSDRPFYQIYSPFAKQWFGKMQTEEVQERIETSARKPGGFNAVWNAALGSSTLEDQLKRFEGENRKHLNIAIPRGGHHEAIKQLSAFKSSLADYKDCRDYPAQPATSRLSMFLKNGTLTVADIIRELGLNRQDFKADTSKTKYLKELVWREFYYHILWHCPRIEIEAFIEKYSRIRWENNESLFAAWKRGETGYPLVDAGMRELNSTGFMHNRVRMVVASFLTKDLLIDWRWGEKYFMEKLLDGDLAPNNGGWQWAASTGCDPQPYFRIFNPVLQSKKFDPDGHYIKRWVPEAVNLAGDVDHEPRSPIVDHAARKEKALKMYTEVG